MVENVGEDDVEPKPAKSKPSGVGVGSGVASGDVKPSKQVEFKVKIPFQAHIVHNQAKPVPTGNFEEKPKPVSIGVCVIEVNTRSFFTTIERWRDREELLGWVRRQAATAGFTISIDKSSTISPYMTMQCERSGEYKPPKTRKKLKLEGTCTRKCNCPFRLKCFFDKKKHKIGGLQCFVEFTTMTWRQSYLATVLRVD